MSNEPNCHFGYTIMESSYQALVLIYHRTIQLDNPLTAKEDRSARFANTLGDSLVGR